mmetsp:Transcript_52118/g.85171  ORF Transcript_52118/g.85171 Transcript_52118/m.85171 type:complete len:120 (+) Transcript_52118:542-901(+)
MQSQERKKMRRLERKVSSGASGECMVSQGTNIIGNRKFIHAAACCSMLHNCWGLGAKGFCTNATRPNAHRHTFLDPTKHAQAGQKSLETLHVCLLPFTFLQAICLIDTQSTQYNLPTFS